MRHLVAGAIAGVVVAVLILALAALAAYEVQVLRCRVFDDRWGGSNLACSVQWRPHR